MKTIFDFSFVDAFLRAVGRGEAEMTPEDRKRLITGYAWTDATIDAEIEKGHKPFRLIVAGGSPSTLFAVAGYCRSNGISAEDIRDGRVDLRIAQAFEVGRNTPIFKEVQDANARVVIIGLPVNNREPEMTTDFVRAIGRDRLVLVCDEHEPERWDALRSELGYASRKEVEMGEKESPFHTPGKGEGHLSAVSIVWGMCTDMPHLWVEAGDWADNRQLNVSAEAKSLAIDVDNAVKAQVADNAFRMKVVRHLLGNDSAATAAFDARLAEGKATEAATAKAVNEGELRGNVLVVHQPSGVEINQTAAMFKGYSTAKVPWVAVVGKKSGEGAEGLMVITIGGDPKNPLGKTNLIEVFKAAGIVASGIPTKANVHGAENLGRMIELLNALK